LDNLVAPIALYPDPLVGQVLAASTYPLEVVEAQQWRRQNQNLSGQQLMDAARQQNWDASVQALVTFPDVLTMLNRDIQWTTDLGNAYLAQQRDVMAAIQRMRRSAQQNGKLQSTSQQVVTTETQNGQSAVAIQPADPQVIYVPVYNPVYVWGPPAWGYYPPLWYPGVGFGFGFGPGIYLSTFFPGWGYGWGGWGLGWGWGCGWFGGGIFVNAGFFSHWGFYHGGWGGYYGHSFGGGRYAWAHDSFHRAGVPYANGTVAARYNNARFNAGRYSAGAGLNGAHSYATNRNIANPGANRGFAESYRGSGANGTNNFNRGSAGNLNRGSGNNFNRGSAVGSYGRSYSAPSNNRGYSAPSSPSFNRGYSTPSYRGYSAPSYNRGVSSPNSVAHSFSSPHSSSGGSRSFSGGGHAGGGHGGGRR
jgi:hypothetical protein